MNFHVARKTRGRPCVAGVRRVGNEGKRTLEAREDWTREAALIFTSLPPFLRPATQAGRRLDKAAVKSIQ